MSFRVTSRLLISIRSKYFALVSSHKSFVWIIFWPVTVVDFTLHALICTHFRKHSKYVYFFATSKIQKQINNFEISKLSQNKGHRERRKKNENYLINYVLWVKQFLIIINFDYRYCVLGGCNDYDISYSIMIMSS